MTLSQCSMFIRFEDVPNALPSEKYSFLLELLPISNKHNPRDVFDLETLSHKS